MSNDLKVPRLLTAKQLADATGIPLGASTNWSRKGKRRRALRARAARATHRGEVRGTEGYEIIDAVGLKQFPQLTERQQRVVEDREREHSATQRQLLGLTQTIESVTRSLDVAPGHTGVGAL